MTEPPAFSEQERIDQRRDKAKRKVESAWNYIGLRFTDATLGMLDSISHEKYLSRNAIITALIIRAYMGDINVEPARRHSRSFAERISKAIARRSAFAFERGRIRRDPPPS